MSYCKSFASIAPSISLRRAACMPSRPRDFSHLPPLTDTPAWIRSRRRPGVCFRSLGESKRWIVDFGDEGYHEHQQQQQQQHRQAKEEEERERNEVEEAERKWNTKILGAAALTVLLGTGNRVLYKLALVPLKHYPFFLAQLATLGYVVVYFSILYWRYFTGIVTDEMLSLPKTPYILIGILESLGAATGMAAGAVLSGASIPILSQTFLIWQLLLSSIFLGRSYHTNQILGCILVSVGVILTVVSGPGTDLSLRSAGIFWTFLMIASFFFQAADTVLKEAIFKNSEKEFKGGSVDLFVVNSFGSAFQAFFLCLLVPFLSKLWGVPFSQLPTYLKDGAACFLNVGSLSGCEGAPLLPVMFVIVNMAFNISLLHLIKISSAVVSCLVSTFTVPISIYAFTLPLPYIGTPSFLPAGFVAGTIVLVSGLLLYCLAPNNQSTSPLSRAGT